VSTSDSLFTRIGRLFGRGDADGAETPLIRQADANDPTSLATTTARQSRHRFVMPWARRDARLENMQQGFANLTDILSSVRDNLDTQNRRQEELISHLSRLPELLNVLPDSARVQEETLRAIHETMELQNGQQKKLGDVLERMNQNDGKHREHLDSIRERVETLHEQDAKIAENLNGVSGALTSVTETSRSSAEALQGLRDNLGGRDSKLEDLLQAHSKRFTLLLVTAVMLSMSALVGVVVVAYIILSGAAK